MKKLYFTSFRFDCPCGQRHHVSLAHDAHGESNIGDALIQRGRRLGFLARDIYEWEVDLEDDVEPQGLRTPD